MTTKCTPEADEQIRQRRKETESELQEAGAHKQQRGAATAGASGLPASRMGVLGFGDQDNPVDAKPFAAFYRGHQATVTRCVAAWQTAHGCVCTDGTVWLPCTAAMHSLR